MYPSNFCAYYTNGWCETGTPLSATLFSFYINDFISLICDGEDISLEVQLLEDIVLMTNFRIMFQSSPSRVK